MSVETRLKNLEAQAVAQGVVIEPESLASVDEHIFRDQLESVVRRAAFRKETEFSGNVQSATDGELLAALGLPDNEEGRAQFRDDQRCWLAVLKHNRSLPHICSEFCSMNNDPGPTTLAGRAHFLADVRWHLCYFERKGFQSSIAQAVALYVFCQRHSRSQVAAVLEAFDELHAEGGVFDDWDYPETPISEAVTHIYDENQKMMKPGGDPYSFRLPVQRTLARVYRFLAIHAKENMEQPFTEFVRTPECLVLVKTVFGSREMPPDVAAVLNGEYERADSPSGKLGAFIEKIRSEGNLARGFDDGP